MAMLVYSDRCQYSSQVLKEIQSNPALLHIVRFHNVSTLGVPSKQITRVPTLVTNDGKILVGQEVRAWLQSMLPVTEIEGNEGGPATSFIDGSENPDQDIFSFDNYGASLAPPMTPDLEKKITQKVQDAYASVQKS